MEEKLGRWMGIRGKEKEDENGRKGRNVDGNGRKVRKVDGKKRKGG